MDFSPLEQRTLQIAKTMVGAKETTGRNDGPIPRLVQRFIANGAAFLDNQPWCVCFAIYCVHKAARELGIEPMLPKTASSSSLYRWFKSRKLLLLHPRPGCIGMVRGGRTGHSHTCLVHAVQGNTVVSVDGNWRNGVGWARRKISEMDYGPIL